MKKSLTHVDASGNLTMVNVAGKESTLRIARARAKVRLGAEIIQLISNDEIHTRKGPVFQTAILAGVMGAKRTSDLIPLCHPLSLEDCKVTIEIVNDSVVIDSMAVITGKTGVEMEALTAATIAALTIYDMCKGLSHNIVIEEVLLLEKTGGKKNFKRQEE